MKLNASKNKTIIVFISRTVHPQSPAWSIGGTVWKESDVWSYWEWHFIPRWLLRCSFIRFPDQLLEGLSSRWSPGMYSMIDCFLGVAFGFFSWPLCITVLQCGDRLPIHTFNTGPCSQWCQFLNYGCVWMWPFTASMCGSIMYAVQDQVKHDAPSFWCSTWASRMCRYVYTRCCDRTLVHLCPSSLQNLALLHNFYSPVWNNLGDRVFDGVGLAGFKSRVNTFQLA